MIFRTMHEATQTDRKVISPDGKWESIRLLLKNDNTGFSFHITKVYKGSEIKMEYKNHIESVYCISGKGIVRTVSDDKSYEIEPGAIYILDKHDKHILKAFEEMELACVFNPALSGAETHDVDGSYKIIENDKYRDDDLYPSRYGSAAKIIERQDKVVYGTKNGHSPIDISLINEYEKNGFLIIENVFSLDELSALYSELDRLRKSESIKKLDETITEKESDEIRSIFRIHEISDVFKKVSTDKRLVDIVRFILDDDIYIHQSRLNYKPGFRGKEFYWHSDFETWHVEDGMPRMRALTISISMTDNYHFNGPLMLIPGSHKKFVVCEGLTPDKHYAQSLKKQDYGVPSDLDLQKLLNETEIVSAVAKPGSIILFDCNLMHGSNGNITPIPRSNLFFVYNSIKNKPVKPYCNLPPRPYYLASREGIKPI